MGKNWYEECEKYYADNPDSRLDYHEVEALLRDKYEAELEAELKTALERASHHAAIASVCSATAERYAAALDSIHYTAANAATDGDLSVSDLVGYMAHIAERAKEARKEAE